mmetsp:Transcript_46785/g.138238  ORF Transcript_46785/g.138238 Transcript_46785/m.138238 type:complete len:264 (+) Transcript_46785:21-812(+)
MHLDSPDVGPTLATATGFGVSLRKDRQPSVRRQANMRHRCLFPPLLQRRPAAPSLEHLHPRVGRRHVHRPHDGGRALRQLADAVDAVDHVSYAGNHEPRRLQAVLVEQVPLVDLAQELARPLRPQHGGVPLQLGVPVEVLAQVAGLALPRWPAAAAPLQLRPKPPLPPALRALALLLQDALQPMRHLEEDGLAGVPHRPDADSPLRAHVGPDVLRQLAQNFIEGLPQHPVLVLPLFGLVHDLLRGLRHERGDLLTVEALRLLG